jgi:hypothetical protein
MPEIMKKPNASVTLLIQALLIVTIGAHATSSNLDIDYSHNVVGSGTIMTDFKMGSPENTLTTGKVRGTGEVMNKYIFQSNNSENVTIEDKFLFSKIEETHEIAIRDYPMMTKSPGRFRMLGTSWAEKIDISQQPEASNQSGS